MEYTQNYHLPQWDETDRIMLPDFNAAMSAIEIGLTATQTAAANALAGLGAGGQNCRVEIGSYPGGIAQTVTLRFAIRPLIVCIANTLGGGVPTIMVQGSKGSNFSVSGFIENIVWEEHSVRWTSSNMNTHGHNYVYVAIGA